MAAIRPMTPADYAAAAAMADEAAAQALVGMPLWENAAEVAAEVGAPGIRAFIVAEDENGAVTGLAGYRMAPGGEAELYGPLVTNPGTGVGAWLESRVVNMAWQQGATAVSMLIGLENRSGAAWAEWRGYLRDTEAPELLLTFLYPGELQHTGPAPDALVRPAMPADMDRLDNLLQECFPQERLGPGAWLHECHVVEAGGVVAGFLRLEGATASIDHLCVDPGLRRRGLGSFLVAETARRFWEREPQRRIGLSVPLDEAAPVSLFRRIGLRREVAVAKWMKR